MNWYTQHDEERIFVEYFGNYKGTLVDIGANDGRTFSNSLRLIELGWEAYLVEPHAGAYRKCIEEHDDNPTVQVFNFGIGKETRQVTFFVGSDSLLSSTRAEHLHIFKDCQYTEDVMDQLSWADFYTMIKSPKIDFLSIDAEGADWPILSQVNLDHTQMVCVEKNHEKHLVERYLLDNGMLKIYETNENLIYARG